MSTTATRSEPTKQAPAKPAEEPRYEPIAPPNGYAPGDGVTDIDDEGVFVPEERFPLIVRFSGDKKVFDAIVAEGKNEKDPKERQRLATKAKTSFAATGFYFIPVEKYIEAGGLDLGEAAPEGWEPYTVQFGDKDTPGYAARTISIAVIRMRRIRELKREHKDSGLPKKWAWYSKMSEIQHGKYQTRLQILCLVKGMEDLGPVTVTMKTSAVTAMLGNRRDNESGIFNPLDSNEGADSFFYKHVLAKALAKARETNKKALVPQNWYWLELTNATDVNGFPFWKKITYGEGPNDFVQVCPPAWARYKQVLDKTLIWQDLYVGDTLARLGDEIRRTKASEWFHKWEPENVAALNQVVEKAEVTDGSVEEHPVTRNSEAYRRGAPEPDFDGGFVSPPAEEEYQDPF